MIAFKTLITFKSDCPKCGGKKKIKTQVDLESKTYSRSKCHKCGFTSPGGIL